ncbi:MAG: molybdopterin-dependent oxidoreductase [Bacteroidales bacterium]|nr:MAG: molybdopterin-dependent oxidoreductase [Bacteroidales bacterium]
MILLVFMMKVYSTACPRNCYSTCSLKVHVDNGIITSIEPHPHNLATPEGPCLKGLSYVERVRSPDRILYPLLRNPVDNEFKRITWNDTFSLLSEKLTFFKEEYGSHSILFYKASGTSGLLNSVSLNFWEMFGGCTLTYGDLCWPAGLEATRLMLGENKHNVPWDLENAKLIIMWGKNAVESNVQEMIPVENAIEKGAMLIVIDPRRTGTADKADLLLQPKPGTDAALALGVARILISEDRIDHDFITRYVLGFSRFRESVEKYTPDLVEQITGIPVEYIHKLAQSIGEIKPMTIIPGYGFQRYSNGGQTVRSVLSLQVITGNIGKKGACWHYASMQSYIFDAVHEPLSLYPDKKHDGIFRRTISTAKLGIDMLETGDPELKMVWVERGNPVTQNPDTHNVLKAFRKLDFRVVIEQFMTDTAREADLILPAKTMFEQSDLIGSYWNPYVQLKQKVIDPPGEVKPESEIYYHLAKKLGFRNEEVERKIPAPGDTPIENWLIRKLEPFPGLTLEKLKEGPLLAPNLEEIAYSNLTFNTPSGKIEIYSEQASDMWQVDPLPSYNEPVEAGSPAEEKHDYPFVLLTPTTKNRIHSQFGNLKIINHFNSNPYVEIAFSDSRERKIREDEMVRIYNKRGEIILPVKINHSLLAGCLVIYNGWWITEGGGVNFLSAPRETDMGYGAAFHENRVDIEPVKKKKDNYEP